MCNSSLSSDSLVDGTLTLIPSLPNDVSALILAHVPYSHHGRLKSTCKSWKLFLSSQTLISIRRKHRLTSHLLCIFPQDPSISAPYFFDPRTMSWCPLPLMPCSPFVYGLCNFVSVSVNSSLYVLGGSLFDTRSFPIDRPSPSSSVFRFDVLRSEWESISPMLSPRGSFACTVEPNMGRIFVAGGGSRHHVFGAAGSRMSSVEMYDIGKDEWVALAGLPRFRAGCVGFVVGNGEEREFWVMGGYGESRTVAGVLPVDQYYKDAVVMEMKNGGAWREVGNMWEDGERMRLGKIVVLTEDDNLQGIPEIFMLDGNHIFRYDMDSNRWHRESSLPRKVPGSAFGFITLGGELHVLIPVSASENSEARRSRQSKRTAGTLLIQIYNPATKTWRSVVSRPPVKQLIDMNTAVMCSIHL
uniref:F-box domain-containing protein n=1 Tax=Kalanchoe fedtschenkoi TaxID=63787 RepID=A0A7N0RA37_KALFE